MNVTKIQSRASRSSSRARSPPPLQPIPKDPRMTPLYWMASMEDGLYGLQPPPLSSASFHRASLHTHRRVESVSSRRSPSRNDSRPMSPSEGSEGSIHLSVDTLPPRVPQEGMPSGWWNFFTPGEMSRRSPSLAGSTRANREDSVVHLRGTHREGSSVHSLWSTQYNLDYNLHKETLRQTLASHRESFGILRTPSPILEVTHMESWEEGSFHIFSLESRVFPLSGWYPTFTSDDAGKPPFVRPSSSVAGVGLSASVYGGRRASLDAMSILLKPSIDDKQHDHSLSPWSVSLDSDDIGNPPISSPSSSVAGVASMSSSFTSSRRGSMGVTAALCGCSSIDQVLQNAVNDDIRAGNLAQKLYEAVNDQLQKSSTQDQPVNIATHPPTSALLPQADPIPEGPVQHQSFARSTSTYGSCLARIRSLFPPLIPHVDQITGPPVLPSAPVNSPALAVPSFDTEDDYYIISKDNDSHESMNVYYEIHRALREGYGA